MLKRSLTEKPVRKLTRMGGGRSLGITLPIEFIRKLGWRERQKLTITLRGKEIVVKDWE